MPAEHDHTWMESLSTRPQTGGGFWLYLLHLITVWGLALSNAFLGLTLLWTAARWQRVRQSAERWRQSGMMTLMLPLVLYSVAFAASVLSSFDIAASSIELRDLIALVTLPLAFVLVRGGREVRLAVDFLIWISVGLAIYGIAQYLVTDYGDLESRIPGPFSHYMTYSGIVLIGACLVLTRLMTASSRARLRNWLILIPILAALGLTLTRNAWLAAFTVVTIAIFVRFRRWLWAYAALVGLLLAMLASLAPQHWSRLTSIVNLEDRSNYDRLCMADAGLKMIADRPVLGIGPGMVGEYYPIYRHPTAPSPQVAHLHNTLLQIGAERGLLSVVAYIWLMAAALLLGYKRYKAAGGLGGPRADLYLGSILTLIAFNVAGLFEANWRDTEIQRWILFLLAVPACLTEDFPAQTVRSQASESGSAVDQPPIEEQ